MSIPIDILAKLSLAPLLLHQARKLRRQALILPEPPGPRSGGSNGNPRLLILGDSSAAGVGAAHQSEGLSGALDRALQGRFHWQLRAETGATTASTLARLPVPDGREYDVALIVLGVNDVTSMVGLRRLLAQRAALYNQLKQGHNVKRIVLSGLPPMQSFPLLPQPLRWVLGQHARRFDAALAQQAHGLGHSYVGFDMPFNAALMAQDGFHPGPAAYQLWAAALAPHLHPRKNMKKAAPKRVRPYSSSKSTDLT